MKQRVSHAFTKVEKLFDAGFYRTSGALMATLGVLVLLAITLVAMVIVAPIKGFDWLTVASIWAVPAFIWIPAVPIAAVFTLSFWGLKDETQGQRTVDIMLATFVVAGGAALIQGISVTLNMLAPSDPTAGLPVPGFLFWTLCVGVTGCLIWNALAYGRRIFSLQK